MSIVGLLTSRFSGVRFINSHLRRIALAMAVSAMASGFAHGAVGWQTGEYVPNAWGPTDSILRGLTAVKSDFTEFSEGSVNGDDTRLAKLTDGSVPTNPPNWDVSMQSEIFGLRAGALEWSFPSTDLASVRIYTRWANGGRDGIGVAKVLYKLENASDWTEIDGSSLSYSVGSNDDKSGSGALYAILRDDAGTLLAQNVVGLKIDFGTGLQDNNGSGYVEIEATSAPVTAVWETGDYNPATWVAAGAHTNLLRNVTGTAAESGIFYYLGDNDENIIGDYLGRLTDATIPDATGVWTEENKRMAIPIQKGAIEWSFEKADLNSVRLFSYWGNGGRDCIGVAEVLVKYKDATAWTPVGGYVNTEAANNDSSSGNQYAILRNTSGEPLARRVVGLKIDFGQLLQDQKNLNNRGANGTGYVEIEAIGSRNYPFMILLR